MNENYSIENFKQYLLQAKDKYGGLDLSDASVLRCIDEMSKAKEPVYPGYSKRTKWLKTVIKNLEKDYGITLMPIQVTDIFWANFVPYLLDKKGLDISSIKSLCIQLRGTLKWASRYKAKISKTYDLLKIPNKKMSQVALSQDEVSLIYHYDLDSSGLKNIGDLKKIRDLFVLSCNFGQRYSDMIRIDKDCFKDGIFSILQIKTGERARLNMQQLCLSKRTVTDILEKYNYKSPWTGSMGKFNKGLKLILKTIGKSFNDTIKREYKIGDTIKTTYSPKWSLVSSHTGRRTFVTCNIGRGMREIDVRRATGHKSDTSFEKYICNTEES